jgi:hypothetical protein
VAPVAPLPPLPATSTDNIEPAVTPTAADTTAPRPPAPGTPVLVNDVDPSPPFAPIAVTVTLDTPAGTANLSSPVAV